MAQVIKSNSKFVSVSGTFTAEKLKPNPLTPVEKPIATPTRPILRQGIKNPDTVFEPESFDEFGQRSSEMEDELAIQPVIELTEEEKTRLELAQECDRIKSASVEEARQIEADARLKAGRILADAQSEAENILEKTAADCEALKTETTEKAYSDGHAAGFADGEEKGYNEGYDKGLRKCRDTLKELMKLLEDTAKVKEQVFREHEHELFDAIFTIANKVSADILKQKDKAVIRNMLQETAKRYRHSEFIKVTLSKLDIGEMGNAEVDALRSIFRETQHVEFEIIKDAPSGTLIMDNGSEITDAGIATQLMMIENLGKGKFKGKPEDAPDKQ